jgi:hypothetical protein
MSTHVTAHYTPCFLRAPQNTGVRRDAVTLFFREDGYCRVVWLTDVSDGTHYTASHPTAENIANYLSQTKSYDSQTAKTNYFEAISSETRNCHHRALAGA